ncbi:MAG: polysaccharide deacetylase family protein [Bacteroidia bacterium]|nr:polysaccharide deacetylase family protein [Bacteroidia bacterium]
MLVFAAQATPRLRYILDGILLHRFGLNYTITDNPDYFETSKTPKINYSRELIQGCVNIPACELLFQETIAKQNIEVLDHPNWKKIFFALQYPEIPDFTIDTSYLPFDILSASFYLLSRYEEYLPSKFDEHNRYKPENSLAFNNDFLEIPLVDYWLKSFEKSIQKCYPALGLNQSKFTQINSIDIDFAYKYKGLSTASKLRKFVGSAIKGKINLLPFNPPNPDPYDQYEFLTKTPNEKGIETIFFFLLANYGNHDKNLSPRSMEIKELVQTLSKDYTCGIHPSYKGALINKLYQQELQFFKEYSGADAKLSRHHFLKIKLPETYVKMEKMGIEHDYTMAYSKQIGFRASTSKPFKCYHLIEEKTLNVWIHSPCIMDVTLKYALNLPVDKAKKIIKRYKETVQEVNGEFISIWHNSNLSEEENWSPWREVYLSLFE